MAQASPRERLAVAGAGILGIGLLFHIIGLATPNWELYTDPNPLLGKLNIGLWEACGSSMCAPYIQKSSELETCEAFAIIGLLLGAGGLGLALIHSFTILKDKPKNPTFPSLSALGGCLACGAVIIVVGVWGGKLHDPLTQLALDAKLGYSFILSIIGGALMGAGGVFVFVVSRDS